MVSGAGSPLMLNLLIVSLSKMTGVWTNACNLVCSPSDIRHLCLTVYDIIAPFLPHQLCMFFGCTGAPREDESEDLASVFISESLEE